MNDCTTMQHTLIDPPNPICAACHTDAHPASAMQPAFCAECVNAMLHGHDNRLSTYDTEPTFASRYIAPMADDVPTDNPDQDTTPETEGPSPLRRPRCTACDTTDYVMSSTHPGICLGCSNAQYWGFASRLEAEPHAWVLPVPILYCSGCLCVAEQLDANAWRCRNPQCLSVWPRDELLTTSALIKRRAALERIRGAVIVRLTCTACGGFHSAQKCPELWNELRADPTLGARLMGLWWKKHASFIAMIVNVDNARRRHYAYSWVAFIRTHNPATTLTADQLLARWAREMDPEPVAMELAA